MEPVSCTQADEYGSATLVGSNFNTSLQGRLTTASCWVLNLIARVLSAALKVFFATVGGCTETVIGALTGWASDVGVVRGVGLCAVAGAVISIEVFEGSHAYWCCDHPVSHSLSSMADFIQKLLHDRFVDDEFQPTSLRASHSQDIRGAVASRGLSEDSLEKLPSHIQLGENKGAQSICCTICLQDIGIREIARRLPRCQHTFHLTYIDKWLIRHDSCPVCRQRVFRKHLISQL